MKGNWPARQFRKLLSVGDNNPIEEDHMLNSMEDLRYGLHGNPIHPRWTPN